jgi:hypothetical protein
MLGVKLLLFVICTAFSTALLAQQGNTALPKYEIDPKSPLDTIFHFVDQMPEFPGGFLVMEKFLKECTAKEKWPVKSSVFLQMIVERDGSLSGIKVLRSNDEYLSAKAVECVMSMPKWQPGKQNGQLKRVLFTIPMKFAPPTDPAQSATRPAMNEFKKE